MRLITFIILIWRVNEALYIYNSTEIGIDCGVPQGSILGPLLFSIYLNDLKTSLDIAKTISFADDTTMYISNKSSKMLFQNANRELSNLKTWFDANKLSLNSKKTKFLLFRTKTMKYNDELSLSIGGDIIHREEFTTFLGMRIDDMLSWDQHINYLHKKLSSTLYVLRSCKHVLSCANLKLLYNTLFESHLRYGIILWSNTSCKNFNLICRIQKKAIRIINKTRYNHPTNTLFKKSNILQLEDLVSLYHYELMYKFTHNILPSGIVSHFTQNSEIHPYATRQMTHPHINKHSSAIYNRSFLNKSPQMYQSLHSSYKTKPTLASFKRSVKKKFVNSY